MTQNIPTCMPMPTFPIISLQTQCGRNADGGIWRNCDLNRRIEQGVAHIPLPHELPGTDVKSPYVIVGDGAFPLTEILQRP